MAFSVDFSVDLIELWIEIWRSQHGIGIRSPFQMVGIKQDRVVRVKIDVPRDETGRNFVTNNSRKKYNLNGFVTQIWTKKLVRM